MIGTQTAYDDSKDQIVVAGLPNGDYVSSMLVRPMMWVHGLAVSPAFAHRLQVRAVESMLQYALGWGPAAPRLICGSLFQIDAANERMKAIADNLGGVEEEGARVIRLDL